MFIKGRGRFTGSITPTKTGATLRVDDSKNDEFWLEIDLSLEELEAVLSRARALRSGENGVA